MDEREYIEKRLKDQISWYDGKSLWNKTWYTRLQKAEFCMAALVPFLVGFLEGSLCLRIVVGLLGVGMAFIGSLHGLMNYHENWLECKGTGETLKHELYFYETKTGPYKNENDPFPILVERVEGIISHENINWAVLSGAQGKQKSQRP